MLNCVMVRGPGNEVIRFQPLTESVPSDCFTPLSWDIWNNNNNNNNNSNNNNNNFNKSIITLLNSYEIEN